MWLVSRLTPDFKTIARFRKDNGKAIRSVCRQFVELCRQLDLFSQAIVAIDGSKFKAVNNRDKNFTSAKMERCKQQLEDSINRYLAAMDSADQEEPAVVEAKTVKLKEKIAALKQRMAELKELLIRKILQPTHIFTIIRRILTQTNPPKRNCHGHEPSPISTRLVLASIPCAVWHRQSMCGCTGSVTLAARLSLPGVRRH